MEIQKMILCLQETSVIEAPILAATAECYSVWWDHLLLPTLFDKGRNTRDWCKSSFLTSTLLPAILFPEMTVFTASSYASPTWGCLKTQLLWGMALLWFHIHTAQGSTGSSDHGSSALPQHLNQELNMPLCNLFIKQCNFHCTSCLDTVSHNCMTWSEVSWVIGTVVCLLISCQSTQQHCNIWANRSFKLHIHASAISENDKWDGIHSMIYLTKTLTFQQFQQRLI